MYIYIYVCMYVCMYVRTYVCTHTGQMCIYKYIKYKCVQNSMQTLRPHALRQ